MNRVVVFRYLARSEVLYRTDLASLTFGSATKTVYGSFF